MTNINIQLTKITYKNDFSNGICSYCFCQKKKKKISIEQSCAKMLYIPHCLLGLSNILI